MCRTIFALLVLLALVYGDIPPTLPSGDYAVVFDVKNAVDAKPLADTPVRLTFFCENKTQVFTEKTDSNGTLVVYADQGSCKIWAEVDAANTPGSDFLGYANAGVYRDLRKPLALQPVGTVFGEASVDGSAVEANLTITCASSAYDPNSLNENLAYTKTGLFSLRMPVGECMVLAKTPFGEGRASVNTTHGGSQKISVKIERPKGFDLTYLALALGFVAFLVIIIFYKRGSASGGEKEKGNRAPIARTSGRAVAPATESKLRMPTGLNEREKQVVQILLDKKGRAKQSLIYRETLIPKASLARVMQSLEERGVIRIHPAGRTRLIEFLKK